MCEITEDIQKLLTWMPRMLRTKQEKQSQQQHEMMVHETFAQKLLVLDLKKFTTFNQIMFLSLEIVNLFGWTTFLCYSSTWTLNNNNWGTTNLQLKVPKEEQPMSSKAEDDKLYQKGYLNLQITKHYLVVFLIEITILNVPGKSSPK